MDLAVKKIELIEWLTKIEDQALIEQIDLLKKKVTEQAKDSNLAPMSSQEYKSLLDQAEEDYFKGQVTVQKDLENESNSW